MRVGEWLRAWAVLEADEQSLGQRRKAVELDEDIMADRKSQLASMKPSLAEFIVYAGLEKP